MECSLASKTTPAPNTQNWGNKPTEEDLRVCGGFRFQEALIDLTTARTPITRR